MPTESATSPRRIGLRARVAVLGAFLLSAVLTPPDAASQIMIAIPLYALFEIGIVLCALGARRRASILPGSHIPGSHA